MYFIIILLRVDKLECQSRQIFQNDEFDDLTFVVVHFITNAWVLLRKAHFDFVIVIQKA